MIVVIALTEFVWPLLSLPAGGTWPRGYFRSALALCMLL